MKNKLKNIFKIWSFVNKKRKIQFSYVLILTIFTSLAEMMTLGLLFPFIATLSSPEKVFNNEFIQPILLKLDITSPDQLILPLTCFFIIAVILSGLLRLLQIFFNIRVSYLTGADLSNLIYRLTLYQPYLTHVSRNSSEIINAISSKTMGVISAGLLPIINILTASIILISIVFTLMAINVKIASISFILFGLIYILINFLTKKKLYANGKLIASESNNVIKFLQEGLGGIREVLIDNNQEVYAKYYSKSIFPLRKSQANNLFLSQSPRFIIEALAMISIILISFLFIKDPNQFKDILPIIGTLVFGAQRLLPLFQQIYSSISTIQGNIQSLNDVLILLEQSSFYKTSNTNKKLIFSKNIKFNNLNYKYHDDGPVVLKNLNLEIKKGDKVGIIGKTGSGKSTFLDILMSLLYSSEGQLIIDDMLINNENSRLWQNNISHVPQNIFLIDNSIKQNIALGVESHLIDDERVAWASKNACINEFIDNLPNKYETKVGERGVRLSGGQMQRIGIARALYKKANVIIFDEATSALDNQTESDIIKSIQNLDGNITLIIVAHRLTTLKNCDYIVELKDSKINRIVNFEKI